MVQRRGIRAKVPEELPAAARRKAGEEGCQGPHHFGYVFHFRRRLGVDDSRLRPFFLHSEHVLLFRARREVVQVPVLPRTRPRRVAAARHHAGCHQPRPERREVPLFPRFGEDHGRHVGLRHVLLGAVGVRPAAVPEHHVHHGPGRYQHFRVHDHELHSAHLRPRLRQLHQWHHWHDAVCARAHADELHGGAVLFFSTASRGARGRRCSSARWCS
mmetsp:Transcript_21889/g.55159  ORF Transcript_21889/g.55159 Transcript_21889/m.55159 type:complete len:215 (+) Transcript_21889:6098-6742(+)